MINELRIGNYVRIKEHFYEGRITCIDAENGTVKTYVAEFYEPLTFEGIEPIPLSPEILEKAGFVEGNGEYWKSIGLGHFRIHLDIDDTDYHVFIRQIDEPEYNKGHNVVLLQEPIFYLHTLQNLYFALTNKELEITL